MKKDIQIPDVKNVYVAALFEYNDDFNSNEWNIYIINENEEALDTLLIVSDGKSDKKSTSTLRKKLERLPAHSAAHLEFLQDELTSFENCFKVTYFIGNKMYHKDFIFPPHSISQEKVKAIKAIDKKGILAQ